jgi:DNA helicase-2/ATP-dependent DNA helicase PcrA
MTDIFSGLNPAQLKAVTHSGTPLLVLAGAGSGKTRVLTHRAAYFVQENLARPDQILLLTFTNKAAGEMKKRMSTLLPGSTFNQNLFAGTFHSFCCQLLRHHGQHLGIPPNFVIYDQSDQESLVKSILLDKNIDPKEFKPKSVLYFIEAAKNNFQHPDDTDLDTSGFWKSQAVKIYRQYQKKLNEYHALDFNDLLTKTLDLFFNYPQVLQTYQGKYPYVLVDEYQDTNRTQYLLTKLLAQKNKQITVVGDASQAIYGWRGADYTNLQNFVSDFSNTTTINLEQNYRSTQTILSAANAVISKNSNHPILKLFTDKKSDDKIKIFEAESEIAEADFVAEKIDFLHHNFHIPLKQIAVLYRMNAQSRVLEEAFLRRSIAYVLLGGTRFYDRAEVKDILSMLRFAIDPDDQISLDRVKKALGVRRLARFQDHLKGLDLPAMTSLQILESLVVNSGYLEKFDQQQDEDQRRIENIKELKSVASAFSEPLAFLENIALVQQEYSLQEKNKKKDALDGVRLMTLHGSKGLEFEAVFLVGFEEGILPHSNCLLDASQVEEERRLCYVGITRAKDYLFLSYASRRLYFGKSSLGEPSRFLADVPQNLTEFDQPVNITRDYRHSNRFSSSDLVYDPDIY